MRISLALTLLSACIFISANMIGFTQNEDAQALEYRILIAESLTMQFAVMIPQRDTRKIEELIQLITKRNPTILSTGIRKATGELIFQSPDHEKYWEGYSAEASNSTHILVPLLNGDQLWGNVEIRFDMLKGLSLAGFIQKELFATIIFSSLIGFVVYLAFMLRTLRELDPSRVIPERVNAAFDTLSEGVMIIDEDEQILLTNKAFTERVGREAISLLGNKASELKWKRASKVNSASKLPWFEVLESGEPIVGAPFDLVSNNGDTIKYAINAAPILDTDGKAQGVLITLDDITQVEEQNVQLKSMVDRLEKSQEQVEEKNEELSYLATRDALTGCLNRRAFEDGFELKFNAAQADNSELCCIMVDLDHFKLVNDNYGHAVGDEVIILLAEILTSTTREYDLVGRYGGEEFCLVLPGMSLENGMKVAERMRQRVADESAKRYENGPHVNASIGIASIRDNPDDPAALNVFADEALYCAKENGRNRVVSYSGIAVVEAQAAEKESADPTPPTAVESGIETLQDRIIELEDIASQFSSELEYSKNYDSLTGLPNQGLFYDHIRQAIERRSQNGQLTAVLIIAIEMFSQINARLGRTGGDDLLKKVAERLNSMIRKSDGISRLSLSRFAGEEFAVLFTGLPQKEQVTWAVKRLIDIINQPIDIDGNTFNLTCNIGISLYPSDANSVDSLLNNAMGAKQHCKQHKPEFGYQFYDRHVHELSVKHLHLEAELCRAIDNEEWILHYQPKLDVGQQKIIGVEALIRWNHPQRGLCLPGEFIEFAEQRGLIEKIGDWVIRETCRQQRSWMDQGVSDCKIAVNISSVQLGRTGFVERIMDCLEEFKVPPGLFEIEITETLIMENVTSAIENLKKLDERGITIAVDDFGTGYSSLGYLKALPLTSLKIDRVFVNDICSDENDQNIVQTVISMAHSMGIKVVAEGVETHEQFELLSKSAVDEIQGYLIGKPVAPEELEKLILIPEKRFPTSEKIVQMRS
jgi:diguanylate cyclase (GGDEF)-like protein/PAS domain S-box-containing protein